jgi:hypothetical protein
VLIDCLRWCIQVDKLELLECVGASSSSIDVSWRPPTKNKERISGYKLMLSTSTGQDKGGGGVMSWQSSTGD